MITNKIYNGDAVKVLSTFPDNSIDTCITSPPYFNLRDYGHKNQIGLEKTPEDYINSLLLVFAEVKRVLKPTGTLWLNIGDSYAGTGKGEGKITAKHEKQFSNKGCLAMNYLPFIKPKDIGVKSKDLIGIPWMLAFALRDQLGYYLRQDIIWQKVNALPESVKDRCVKSHEYIFLLSKSKNYFFDYKAIQEPTAESTRQRLRRGISESNKYAKAVPGQSAQTLSQPRERRPDFVAPDMRNKRDVWTVTNKHYKGAHFATLPMDLIEPCILAGSPESGVALDPFCGAGTVPAVAVTYNRKFIGIDINPEYVELSRKRVEDIITRLPYQQIQTTVLTDSCV